MQVLSIQRGSVVIPNPRGDREILPGDVLLCFGKMITLKGMIPPTKPRRAKKPKSDGAAAKQTG